MDNNIQDSDRSAEGLKLMNPNGVINEPIVHKASIAGKAVLSALGLVAYMALFKYIYDFELKED